MFYRLKATYPDRLTRLRLRCIPRHYLPADNIDWLYMEAGRDESEITEIIDARDYHDKIVEVIRTHHSQREDGEIHIARYGNNLGINHFIIKE